MAEDNIHTTTPRTNRRLSGMKEDVVRHSSRKRSNLKHPQAAVLGSPICFFVKLNALYKDALLIHGMVRRSVWLRRRRGDVAGGVPKNGPKKCCRDVTVS